MTTILQLHTYEYSKQYSHTIQTLFIVNNNLQMFINNQQQSVMNNNHTCQSR